MISRCRDSKNPLFKGYGQRGIKVCDRWSDFQCFAEDMGPKPSKRHSIDRIDVNGPYAPENTRWALPVEQMNNRRVTRYGIAFGRKQSLTLWAREYGLPPHLIFDRVLVQKMKLEDALSKPRNIWGWNTGFDGVKVPAFGQSLTVKQWAISKNIKEATLRYRLRKGWAPEDALTRKLNQGKRKKSTKRYTFDGRTLTMNEWSALLKVKVTTLNSRMRKNYPYAYVFTDKTFQFGSQYQPPEKRNV